MKHTKLLLFILSVLVFTIIYLQGFDSDISTDISTDISRNYLNISRPNFFILGTRKGGTTSLITYLSKHPDVYALNINGNPWDGEVFGDMRNLDSYKKSFKNVPSNKLVGDSNVFRLMDNVHHLAPYAHKSKFIVLLRDPIARCLSQMLMRLRLFPKRFAQMGRNLTAWLEKEKQELFNVYDPNMLDNAYPPQLFKSSKNCWYEGAYYFHLKRLFKHIPRSDVKIVLSEDLFSYTEKTVFNVMDFIGLDKRQINTTIFENKYNQRSKIIHHEISEKLKNEMEQFYRPLKKKLDNLMYITDK